MKKNSIWMWIIMVSVLLAACGAPAAASSMDAIRQSAVARLEEPDGKTAQVDSEIASLRGFCDLALTELAGEPADDADEALYRMVFDPSERVKGRSETVVSFYKTYVTVNEKYYGAANAAAYEEVLEWVAGKFASFLGE